MENFFDQKARIEKELKEAHKPFNFYHSDKFEALNSELNEALEAQDLESCIDIFSDIETAKKNFKKSLPWWYSARWNNDLLKADPEAYKQALKEYEKNIYEKRF